MEFFILIKPSTNHYFFQTRGARSLPGANKMVVSLHFINLFNASKKFSVPTGCKGSLMCSHTGNSCQRCHIPEPRQAPGSAKKLSHQCPSCQNGQPEAGMAQQDTCLCHSNTNLVMSLNSQHQQKSRGWRNESEISKSRCPSTPCTQNQPGASYPGTAGPAGGCFSESSLTIFSKALLLPPPASKVNDVWLPGAAQITRT